MPYTFAITLIMGFLTGSLSVSAAHPDSVTFTVSFLRSQKSQSITRTFSDPRTSNCKIGKNMPSKQQLSIELYDSAAHYTGDGILLTIDQFDKDLGEHSIKGHPGAVKNGGTIELLFRETFPAAKNLFSSIGTVRYYNASKGDSSFKPTPSADTECKIITKIKSDFLDGDLKCSNLRRHVKPKPMSGDPLIMDLSATFNCKLTQE